MIRPGRSRLAFALASLVAAPALLSGCSIVGIGTNDDPSSSPTTAVPSAKATPYYDSQFTRDGTFQSHIKIDGVDFVYTLYPTKSTPRTNEWYPRGNKFFSFTFQAYDLNRAIRAPFATKRKIYLSDIAVTSRTKTVDGGRTQHPYKLSAIAKNVTFDPEPLTTQYGMIITSPKGAFELRNQKIRPTSMDTRGIDLKFTATVHIQRAPGSASFYERKVRQSVPVAIFASKKPTEVAKIPVDAN